MKAHLVTSHTLGCVHMLLGPNSVGRYAPHPPSELYMCPNRITTMPPTRSTRSPNMLGAICGHGSYSNRSNTEACTLLSFGCLFCCCWASRGDIPRKVAGRAARRTQAAKRGQPRNGLQARGMVWARLGCAEGAEASNTKTKQKTCESRCECGVLPSGAGI